MLMNVFFFFKKQQSAQLNRHWISMKNTRYKTLPAKIIWSAEKPYLMISARLSLLMLLLQSVEIPTPPLENYICSYDWNQNQMRVVRETIAIIFIWYNLIYRETIPYHTIHDDVDLLLLLHGYESHLDLLLLLHSVEIFAATTVLDSEKGALLWKCNYFPRSNVAERAGQRAWALESW